MPKMIRVLGSLNFAVSLLVGLVVILSCSTISESLHGTPFAQENFYRAHWFDLFLALVWTNIFCATLTRWPFKRKHIGFVTTHVGILLLLIGAFLTRQIGIEGQMTVFENEIKSKIISEGLTLRIRSHDDTDTSLDLKPSKNSRPHRVALPHNSIQLDVLEVLPHALISHQLIENPAHNGSNYAVQAIFSSEMMGAHESFTLIKHDPDDHSSSTHTIGPATFRLDAPNEGPDARRSEPSAHVLLFQHTSGLKKKIGLPDNDVIDWTETGLTVQNIRYFPQAKIADKKLVNDPSSVQFNPAVEFDVVDADGHKESHTKFMLFPDFGSLRGGSPANHFDLSVTLDASIPPEFEDNSSPTFHFIPAQDGSWKYRVTSSKIKDQEPKPLVAGQKIPTGWMDMQIEVKQVLQDALIQKVVSKDPQGQSGIPAVRIRAQKGDIKETHWILSNQPLMIGNKKDGLHLSIEPKSTPMKFSIALKDFRKIDYPGTSNPSSFESDVTLTDPTRGIRIDRTISMNKPLDYDGYRIFQSSFIQDEELGEASVFTVAKNPGMMLIYPGAVLILIGVILLFYFHPAFSGKSGKGGT